MVRCPGAPRRRAGADILRGGTAGAGAAALQAQALAQGAHAGQTRWSPQADGSEQLWATFTGVFPLSRHICLVTARAGQVVEARLAYLD